MSVALKVVPEPERLCTTCSDHDDGWCETYEFEVQPTDAANCPVFHEAPPAQTGEVVPV